MVGKGAFEINHHAIVRSVAKIGSAMPQAHIPFVVEVWAEKQSEKGNVVFRMMVNRSPIIAEVGAYRDADKDLVLVRGRPSALGQKHADERRILYPGQHSDPLLPDHVRRQKP